MESIALQIIDIATQTHYIKYRQQKAIAQTTNQVRSPFVKTPIRRFIVHPLYTEQQLQSKKLTELKAIALQINAVAIDKRSKESWVSAILSAQPQPVEPLEVVKPVATCTDCPRFQSYNDGTDKGWCYLFDRFARNHHEITQDCINTIEVDEQTEETQPVNLPCVGETHFVGDRLLRCIEVGEEYAAVWDVLDNGVTLGEIQMNWDYFWTHNLSLSTFATPQEAVLGLIDSASELIKKPELEVITTASPTVFLVVNHESKNQYRVCLKTNSCTCPHWNHRHKQPGFEDKHILAARVFANATKSAATIEQEHADAWDRY